MEKSASFWLAAAAAAREDKIRTNADYFNGAATASQTAFPRSMLPRNNDGWAMILDQGSLSYLGRPRLPKDQSSMTMS